MADRTECRHLLGDVAADSGNWLCGQCYKRLAERPTRYGMEAIGIRIDDEVTPFGQYRQVITWQAAIPRPDGYTLWQFVMLIADRFMKRGGMDATGAIEMAIEALRNQGDEFGSPDIDWGPSAASDLADEEMTYWDGDSAGPENGGEAA